MSKFSVKGNANYCASIVKIENIIPLEKRDNIVGTMIYGNHVIVSKETKVGDIGIYFPVESALSDQFLKENNLYRESSLNADANAKGYFEKNRRIRCMKFGGHKSEGLFMPLSSIKCFTNDVPEIGTDFDFIDDTMICEKYIIKTQNMQSSGNKESKQNKKLKRISKLIEKQFEFHKDTAMFGKNVHKFDLDDLISVTYKMHGCVSANTIVNTLEGDFTIKEIVESKKQVKIKAFDVESKEIVYVDIDQFYTKKDDGEWFEIELEDGTILEITSNNPMWLPELNCYRRVEDLKPGDIVLKD